MSDSTNSHLECQGYNSDVRSSSSPQDIPPSVIFRREKPTYRANTPPPGLRTFFVVALDNGLRLPVYPYIGEVLSMASIGLAQLTLNMWISIIGFYSACFLAGVTPTAEFFFTTFSQHTQKDGFLYFMVRVCPKVFPFGSCLIRGCGLSPIAEADLGTLEALRVSYRVPDHAPFPPPTAPVIALNQLPPRPPTLAPEQVEVDNSSEEDEAMSPFLRRPRFPLRETSSPGPQDADPEPQRH
ncbi:hypothetical protein LIER_22220 [Lithospermum erythrorhizon]|uniref:Uncharacterized protein n=1 Tax=Lithospermum erythrorhizon TaxID=34254 RepID=A0AAV3QT90_LITER